MGGSSGGFYRVPVQLTGALGGMGEYTFNLAILASSKAVKIDEEAGVIILKGHNCTQILQ